MYLGGDTLVPHRDTIKCLEVLAYGEGVSMVGVGWYALPWKVKFRSNVPHQHSVEPLDLHREVCSLDLTWKRTDAHPYTMCTYQSKSRASKQSLDAILI